MALAAVRNNLGRKAVTRSFELSDRGITWGTSLPGLSADDLIPRGRRRLREETAAELTTFLSERPRWVEEVKEHFKQAHVSWSTVQNAKEDLGVEAIHVGGGADGMWVWSMPELHAGFDLHALLRDLRPRGNDAEDDE